MSVPFGLKPSILVALVALASWAGEGRAGAAGLPDRLTPSYRGMPYDRLTIPAAAFRRSPAVSMPGSPQGPRYAIFALGDGRAERAGVLRLPVAINRQGRILLDEYRPGPHGGTLAAEAVVVGGNRASAPVRAACPACDPTPLSQSTFNALALDSSDDVVGFWNDYLPATAPNPAYDLTYFVRWTPDGASVAQLGFSTRDAAYAMNDRGVAAGQDGTFAARFAQNGYTADLGTLSGTHCDARATAINDAGTIAGMACAGDASVAVTFPATGAALRLPSAAAPSAAEAINAAGSIAGFAGRFATLWIGGGLTYLPLPAGLPRANAVAFALNVAGDAVGDVYYGNGGSQAVGGFLFARGQTYLLDALLPPGSGWRIVHVTGIDDSGDVVGVGMYRESRLLPFVLKKLHG